jgi:hypothetical protein
MWVAGLSLLTVLPGNSVAALVQVREEEHSTTPAGAAAHIAPAAVERRTRMARAHLVATAESVGVEADQRTSPAAVAGVVAAVEAVAAAAAAAAVVAVLAPGL